jgi:polar amino acid transport system substrate-binding protein
MLPAIRSIRPGRTVLLLSWAAVSLLLPLPAEAQLRFSVVEGATNMQISERVLAEAYQRLGMSFQLERYPGARSLRNVDSGFVDGEVSRLGGLEKTHPNLLRVAVAVNQLEAVAFSRDIDVRVQGWASLKPYRVGIRRGVAFAERGTAAAGIETQTVDSVEQLFHLLQAGRVDLVVLARINGLEAIEVLGDPRIHPLDPPVESFPLFHYLHAHHRDLVPRLTTVLKQMAKEGRIRQIREDFILQRFGTSTPGLMP